MITVRKAPAYATIQDDGRRGFMASGVPRCGAMDVASLRTLNATLGNDNNAAAIECALTGGELELTAKVVFAIGGAAAQVTHNGHEIEHFRAISASPGDVISIATPTKGRFLYIAFAGGIDVPLVMKSHSTYVPGSFGGLEGRRLKSGDVLRASPQRHRHYVTDLLPESLRPSLRREIRFVPRDTESGFEGEWTVSAASDRTGYRLTDRLLDGGASITSEPVCPGTIQLPPGGAPIVLMADAPTVGGYRILGGVITADLGALAQSQPGASVGFVPISVDSAQREVANEAARLERIREWSLS